VLILYLKQTAKLISSKVLKTFKVNVHVCTDLNKVELYNKV